MMSMSQFLSVAIDMLCCCDSVLLQWHNIDVIHSLSAISMGSVAFMLMQSMFL